ncbi:hypothetical protein [Streptomyces lydicamycinicus]|uniref:hypothetical protein n=1 Tax=Streptomyces lydicamycinicus TaxID=1546107 RepID=UPI003C2C3A35
MQVFATGSGGRLGLGAAQQIAKSTGCASGVWVLLTEKKPDLAVECWTVLGFRRCRMAPLAEFPRQCAMASGTAGAAL